MGPTRHAYTWQIGPFWQDTLDIFELKLIMVEVAGILMYAPQPNYGYNNGDTPTQICVFFVFF